MPTNLPPTIPEKNLAEKIGVDRSVLFQLRVDVLKADVDWTRDGNAVVYLQAGVDQVCTHLHLEPFRIGAEPPPLPPVEKNDGKESAPAALPDPEKNAAEKSFTTPAPIGPVKLTITRRARLNTKVIFAQAKTGAPEIAVRVRDNTAFRAGQEIHVTLQPNHTAALYGPQPKPRPSAPLPKR